jgi:hypothetical protein
MFLHYYPAATFIMKKYYVTGLTQCIWARKVSNKSYVTNLRLVNFALYFLQPKLESLLEMVIQLGIRVNSSFKERIASMALFI